MRTLLPQNLIELAKHSPLPVYVVGGFVRDYLANRTSVGAKDIDLCAPISAETFVNLAKACGLSVDAVYKNTGTVKFSDSQKNGYEFSSFRSDKYVRGIHTPVETVFTDDICLDARRRDFTANAVYYDIAKDEFVDPLNGMADIARKRMRTVAPANKVFGEDGLRLMRLCRQCAQLGFSPDEECLSGAKQNAALIQDISKERIFAELCAILSADKKYGVTGGQYEGVRLLDQTGVLDYILPELTLGRNMAQRADFHKYDVLQHSLRAVLYADESVRFAALLHDIGKPLCQNRDQNSFSHPEEGERLAIEILQRLKAPKRLISRVSALVKWHMYDFDCKTKENKLRRFFATYPELLDELLLVKQADFSACTDDTSIAPTVQKWKALLAVMRREGAPLTLKELAVSGKDLLEANLPPERLSEVLHALLLHAAVNPKENTKERLIRLAKGFLKGAGMR